MSSFASLGFSKPILSAITAKGYDTPTAIQAGAIPPALEGRDVLGRAQTGTGKTAAFALPLLDRLLRTTPDNKHDIPARGPRRARALVLAPTRELATQIAASLRDYGKGTGLRGCVIYGGVSQHHQVRDLRRGVDVVVATPGRLMDLMDQGHADLSGVEILVLDEADRMLDMGFIHPIRKIAARLPRERQSLMFSATMPRQIAALAGGLLRDPARVEVADTERAELNIEQTLHHVDAGAKAGLLNRLLADEAVTRAVVFIRTKHGADKLTKRLARDGVRADSIHGNKSQNQRTRALDAFRAGRTRVLVATDVAARGLDVDGVTHVFNFNLPSEPEAYVHRIGRTGRAGAAGIAVSFCDPSERALLRSIERLIGRRIELAPEADRAPQRTPDDALAHGADERSPAPARHPLPRQGAHKPRGGGKPTRPRGKTRRAHATASNTPANPRRGKRTRRSTRNTPTGGAKQRRTH